MGQKRRRDETMVSNDLASESQSPFLPMFETFRKELDEHHDRRERVIKASRDVTASAKKIIFTLQRLKQVNQPLPPFAVKANTPFYDTIKTQYKAVSKDLQGLNAHRYERNITGGNQEFMEAACFEHYIATGTLLSYDQACAQLVELGGEDGPIRLSPEDYLLGVYDMTGELMRFAITIMAGEHELPSYTRTRPTEGSDSMEVDSEQGNILADMRKLRAELEELNVGKGSPLARDVYKKAEVMRSSVEKVERGLYGLVVRGRERPKGSSLDEDSGGSRQVEIEA